VCSPYGSTASERVRVWRRLGLRAVGKMLKLCRLRAKRSFAKKVWYETTVDHAAERKAKKAGRIAEHTHCSRHDQLSCSYLHHPIHCIACLKLWTKGLNTVAVGL
jgi:hypothetical protein